MSTTTSRTQIGECRCGARVERELPEGRFAALAARLPFVCGACARREEAELEAEQAALEQERREARIRRRRERAGLPDGLTGCPLEQPDARAWAEGRVPGLMLTGPVGVGKTTAAAAAAEHVLRRGRPLRWLSAPLLFARLGSGMGTRQREQALDALTGSHALVLDDIDKARPTEYAAEHVFLAVDTRITDRTPLLITSNMSLAELAQRWPDPYGEAIASRIAGYCRIAFLDGIDRRTAP